MNRKRYYKENNKNDETMMMLTGGTTMTSTCDNDIYGLVALQIFGITEAN